MGNIGGNSHIIEHDISERIKSAMPPWYRGVVVRVDTGLAGMREGRWLDAEA
jgi:hypothetical protein